MKIGSELQFEVPDECPSNCGYKDEPTYQGSTCTRCPVFNCKPCPSPNGEVGDFCLVEPQGFRDDWANMWELYFIKLEGHQTIKED